MISVEQVHGGRKPSLFVVVLALAIVVVTAPFPLVGAPVWGIVYVIGRQRKEKELVLVGVVGFVLSIVTLALLHGV